LETGFNHEAVHIINAESAITSCAWSPRDGFVLEFLGPSSTKGVSVEVLKPPLFREGKI
jgi:hypothetical protein